VGSLKNSSPKVALPLLAFRWCGKFGHLAGETANKLKVSELSIRMLFKEVYTCKKVCGFQRNLDTDGNQFVRYQVNENGLQSSL